MSNAWRQPDVDDRTLSLQLDGSGSPPLDRSYCIQVGSGILGRLGVLLAAAGQRRAVMIVDEAVVEPHATAVVDGMEQAGLASDLLTVPAGEASKSLAEAGRLWEALAQRGVDRQTVIVAVGGGVVGDLAGFVAAGFARGIPCWQIPTTLVAQVDSAIGGKTGINLAAGKNLVGAFWQPQGVLADIDTLATLPGREFTSGLAEVVKYGMILDAEFFAWLESNTTAIVAREPAAIVEVVHRSAALKAYVVERDERELTGLRACLNYGHTFAHAFETATGYGTLLHGEAVSLGMVAAARLACALGRIDESVADRQLRLLEQLDLPVSTESLTGISDDHLLAIMARDKKTLHGQLRFVLPDRIGQVELVAGVTPEAASAAITAVRRG
jgi:3-dehydroquinate synthase